MRRAAALEIAPTCWAPETERRPHHEPESRNWLQPCGHGKEDADPSSNRTEDPVD